MTYVIVILFQYTRDKSNQEAYNNLMLIEPLEQDISNARQLFEKHEYNGAIQLLSRAVEVGTVNVLNPTPF